MLSLGQRLRDRYRIDALPDTANGSLVYRAYDIAENRLCAIKEYEGEQAARLEREAEALTLHRHPNLPTAFEAFSEAGHLYLVLEWPEGESLQARLKREGRLPEADAIRYLTQVLASLDYIHTLNLPMARGGFAPAHLWVAPDGRPRLYAGVASITNAAPYTAPEGGNEPRASIFTAGSTLYALLTGRSPEGNTSPRKHNPTVSPATTQIVQRALNRRPEARFATLRDMRKALGRARSGEGLAIPLTPRAIPIVPIATALVVIGLITAAIFLLRNTGTTAAARSTDLPAPTLTVTPPASATRAPATPTAPPPTGAPPPTRTQRPTREPTPTATPNQTPQAGSTTVATTDGMILIYIPSGSFIMGSPNEDPQAFGNEKPQHTETVEAFWIDQTEITNRQYQACVEAGACAPPISADSATRPDYFNDPQYADYPVVWVNWVQASAYCSWAGRRLPSEAEWEKAARSDDGRLYPWGNEPPDNTLLNFNLAAKDTTPVGSFPNGASPYGVLDMAGNVVEWIDGFYYDSYFVIVANTVTPTPAFRGGVRPLRSSSWNDLFENIRAASRRYSTAQTSAFNDVGFRCAADD